MRLDRRPWRRLTVVRDWPLWSLPRWLTVFVLAVAAVYFSGIGLAAWFANATGHDLILFGVLITCTLVAIELTRKMGEPGHTAKDVYGIWEFPIAILLPPLFALLAPVPRIVFQQWRVRRAPLYRRVFTSAANGLSYGAASLTFHGLSAALMSQARGVLVHDLAWTLMVSVSALVYMIVNKALIMTAVSGTGPSLDLRRQFFGGETLYNDSAEICIGFLVTYAVAGNLFLAPAALPVVALLQRSLRHVQLVTDSRADSKTGLLNAATWERESAVALLDIDKFKAVNDTHGHLVGDQVLKEIAKTLNSLLRDYDLAGRFGGEEFAILLPQTKAVDAFRTAERVRAAIAALNILVPGMSSAERVQVTVSIGVAALDAGSKRQLSELLAAADAAMYRAKACGRDQVQMISTTRGLSAITGMERGSGGQQDAPSVFRRAQSS
jgi:diguanylate cyclase (GGDEF)-like protein